MSMRAEQSKAKKIFSSTMNPSQVSSVIAALQPPYIINRRMSLLLDGLSIVIVELLTWNQNTKQYKQAFLVLINNDGGRAIDLATRRRFCGVRVVLVAFYVGFVLVSRFLHSSRMST